MRLLSRLALVMVFFGAWSVLIGAAAASPQLVLTHVSVIDSTANAVRPDQSVVIVNGRIAAIGPSARIKLPKDARIVDGQGKFLIPGLWDMHVHIAGLNADPGWSKQVLLPLLLANGVTGVRDMGGDLDSLLTWKREIEAGTLLGPHIVACGPFLVGSGNKTAEQYPIANVDEARAAVRGLKRRGAEFIKIISVPSKEVFFCGCGRSQKAKHTARGALAISGERTGSLQCGHAQHRTSPLQRVLVVVFFPGGRFAGPAHRG